MRSDVLTPEFRRVFAANFISDLSFAMFIHFPGYLAGLGAGETLIGVITAVAMLVSIMSRPGLGVAIDRVGRVPVVRAAAVVRVLSVASFFVVDAIGPLVFVSRAVYAASLAIMFTGYFTYASDVIPAARRAQGIALYGLSGMIPAMFGAALGDLLIDGFGYGGWFGALMTLDLIGVGVASTLRPVAHLNRLRSGLSARRLMLAPALRPVWVLTLAFGLSFGTIITFLRTFVDASGVGTTGLFMFFYSGTAVVLRLSLSWLPDRVRPLTSIWGAIASMAVGFALLALSASPLPFVAAAVLAGTGHAFLFPVLGKLVVDRAPDANRGSGMGIWTAAFDVAILVGGPVLGWIIESAGYPAAFGLVSAALIAGAAGFTILDSRAARDDSATPVGEAA